MIRSYLTLALRIMMGQRGFVFINVSGLTIGIACSLLLFIYIRDELSFDRFHRDADRIFRIAYQSRLQGRESVSAETGAPLAAALQQSPEVESVLRLANWPTFPIRFKDKAFTEPYLLLADSNFFRFFDFELVAGNPKEVLKGKDKLVVSESAARRYFGYTGPGDPSPIGQTMTLAQGYEATVAGIAKDPPHQSHFHYTVLLSLDSWQELKDSRWTDGLVVTYAKLKDKEAVPQVQAYLENLVETAVARELEDTMQTTLLQFERQGNYLDFFTQPLTSIHLRSNLADEIEANGNIQTIYLLAAIALFITLLACINYMNLSTARSASRAKEVGVRKTVGARQSRLMAQFLLESVLYTLLSVLLALGLVRMALLPFNLLTGKNISFAVFAEPGMIVGLLVFILMIGFLAGSYPALYLARFSPIEVLKGRVRMGRRKYGIRNTLVVFQFFISITLIIATLVVYRQLQYIQNQSPGFDTHHTINLLHTANLGNHAADFKKALLTNPHIASASFANRLPPNIDWQFVFRVEGREQDYLLTVYEMDGDHLTTMGYRMKSGRYFSATEPADSTAVIINESAALALGLLNTPTDSVWLTSTYDAHTHVRRKLIGIISDFNFRSFKDPIQPLAIVKSREPNWEMAIRLRTENPDSALVFIEQAWHRYAAGAPFEYTFVDNNFRSQYAPEKRLGTLFLIFTILAIFIACLGVFGLATYMAEQRTKEIGIRKVLGASSIDIVLLLTLQFARLIVIAFLVAIPLAGWALHTWLSQYAYHIALPVSAFVLAALLALFLALISASHRALKAALSNPVNSLRTE